MKGETTVPMTDVLKKSTIMVRVTKKKEAKLRLCAAILLIRLAVWVLGARLELNHTF